MRREHQLLGKPSPLPSGYQQLNYIQANGTQYIRLNYTPVAPECYSYIAYGEFTQLVNRVQILFGNDSTSMSCNKDGLCYNRQIYPNVHKFEFILRQKTGTYRKTRLVDDVIGQDNDDGYYPHQSNATFTIFTTAISGRESSYMSYAKFYGAQVFDVNGNVIREYIPALRTSDNIAGVYDTKNSAFMVNRGSGTIIYG